MTDYISLNDQLGIILFSRDSNHTIIPRWLKANRKLTYSYIDTKNHKIPPESKHHDENNILKEENVVPISEKPVIKSLLRSILDSIEEVADIKFEEVVEEIGSEHSQTKAGNIRLCLSKGFNVGSDGVTFSPCKDNESFISDPSPFVVALNYKGRAFSDSSKLDQKKYTEKGAAQQIIRHEFLHTLGFGHTKDDRKSKHVHSENVSIYQNHYDSRKYSDMSYNPHQDNVDFSPFHHQMFSVTPAVNDIAALHLLYGPNKNNKYAGDTVHKWGVSKISKVQCLYDPSGNDTFDFYSSKGNSIFDMREGQHSSLGYLNKKNNTPARNNFSLAYGTHIENVNASNGVNVIFTNALDNQINGRNGDNWIYVSDRHIQTTLHRIYDNNGNVTPEGKEEKFATQKYVYEFEANGKTYQGFGNDVYKANKKSWGCPR